jgi:protein-tyrosine phosphatase
MLPLVDVHCHLLAGLDDGPRTWDDALAMCRTAHADGTRMIAATAHQNETYPDVTPGRIRDAAKRLGELLGAAGVELAAFPTAEVMAHVGVEGSWDTGQLLSVADRGRFLLLEMPHRLFVDLRPTVEALRRRGIRLILAHPERHPEWLHEPGSIEEMIRAGCLVQVSAGSITDPPSAADRRALKDWFRRGCVHLLGSDGHSPRRRPPLLAAAYRQVRRWVGNPAADRIASTNGVAVLSGLPLRVAEPVARRAAWFLKFW